MFHIRGVYKYLILENETQPHIQLISLKNREKIDANLINSMTPKNAGTEGFMKKIPTATCTLQAPFI